MDFSFNFEINLLVGQRDLKSLKGADAGLMRLLTFASEFGVVDYRIRYSNCVVKLMNPR
jgi:hypothetical protein